ncbi:hypothetical protein EV44_g1480 [Erysiphe necator]|uniref:Uncharacterized protein n=1 Tax=Uncinula necator TaxID=52586 RepID=A0A0B1P8S2_UNCNE|nr:hypothetical protein EV44_g1480 [Erysiphe necator]
MSEHSNGTNTLPRDFRFRYQDTLTTPEPVSSTEVCQPSPPRQRLKVRRRVNKSLQAPTKQFLASVEAADFPLPTIEYTKSFENIYKPDQVCENETESFKLRRCNSTPKTPAHLPSIKRYEIRPDWYMDDIQENSLERPSSSHSIGSDASYQSSYSIRQSTCISEDGSCTSPDSEYSDPFNYASLNVNEDKYIFHQKVKSTGTKKLNSNIRNKAYNGALWSKAQISHLWSTYLLYLQDPTVTPLRIGASRVPPEGVCHRVAREAKRSWKGPKTTCSRISSMRPNSENECENIASIEKKPRNYVQWPHSSSATRNKLRYICRQSDQSALYRFHHYLQSRSPTPFSKSINCRELQNISSGSQESNLNVHDISISLSLSTSETMRPDGVLACLAQDDERKINQPPPDSSKPLRRYEGRTNMHVPGYSLGSPFYRTYGPSSSRTNELITSPLSRNLGSPLQISKARSLNGMQRRRAQLFLREEYKQKPPVVQLSNHYEYQLNNPIDTLRTRTRGFSVGDESQTTKALHSALDLRSLPINCTWPQGLRSLNSGNLHSTRLRSPFAESSSNDIFPRFHAVKSKFTPSNVSSTPLHQTRRSIESYDFGKEQKSLEYQALEEKSQEDLQESVERKFSSYQPKNSSMK